MEPSMEEAGGTMKEPAQLKWGDFRHIVQKLLYKPNPCVFSTCCFTPIHQSFWVDEEFFFNFGLLFYTCFFRFFCAYVTNSFF